MTKVKWVMFLRTNIPYYILFIFLVLILIAINNIFTPVLTPVMEIVIFYIFSLILIFHRVYQYTHAKILLIEKKYDYYRFVLIVLVSFMFFSRSTSDHNPMLYGCSQSTWIGFALIVLGGCQSFRHITFKKTGIRRSGSFLKTYYSDITSFELTDTTVSYSSKNGESYTAKIFKPILDSKDIIKKKVHQH